MGSINITLETLYDILRNEKKREDLQELEDSFFIDVVTYVREKKIFLETKQDDDNPFAVGDKEKLEYELRSIKRILKEIYEKREKKIIDIALNKSKTGSDIIDTSALLREEKIFYDKVLKICDNFRRGILLNLFNGDLPDVDDFARVEARVPVTPPKPPVDSSFTKYEGAPPIAAEDDYLPDEFSSDEEEESEEISKIKVLIINAMPSFVWKDLQVYGPYDKGEEVEIFTEVAELMIRKGRAEKI